MTAPTAVARTPELAPLAEYLAGVLKTVRPLPVLGRHLTQSYGTVIADEVRAPTALPAFDHASIDGYAARLEDILGAAAHRSVRLNVVGDLGPSSWRPVRLAPGTCFSVAAGAPLPAAADVVVPPAWTDQGMAAVEIREQPRRGHGVRRAGDEIRAGAVIAAPGAYVTPALVAVLAATGVDRVVVRPSPRVAVIATGDELVEAGGASRPGEVADATSLALVAAAAEAGAFAYRAGICADDSEALRGLVDEQVGQADLIVTSGGTGVGPGDIVRRALGGDRVGRDGPGRDGLGRDGSVRFTEVSLFPCSSLGYGALGPAGVSVICLPGDPGAALIGFEVLARPVIQKLAGAETVFRHSVRAHLLETVASPLGLREFRPAYVSERRGGGYTAKPLSAGPYTLSGLAPANGLIVLGERVDRSPAGSTVDVLLLDRRR